MWMARCIMVHTFLCVLLRKMRVRGARKAKRNALLVLKFSARLPRIVAVAAGRIAAVAVSRSRGWGPHAPTDPPPVPPHGAYVAECLPESGWEQWESAKFTNDRWMTKSNW